MEYPSQIQIEKALAYTALQYFDTSKIEINGLSFPMGRLSYRLWPHLDKFIDTNQKEIKFETKRIESFINQNLKITVSINLCEFYGEYCKKNFK